MSTYSNGPGNIPRLPENVIHHLIAMADVSHNARRRFAPGPTGFTEYAQTAQLEQLVHDACEELLARLPAAVPASEPVAVHFVKSLIHPNGWHECNATEYAGHVLNGFVTRTLYTGLALAEAP